MKGVSLLLVFAALSLAKSDHAFASTFHGGAVLQSGVLVTIWGNSSGTDSITLTLDGKHAAVATPATDGKWTARIPSQQPSWASVLTAKDSSGRAVSVTIKFGQVVLCSGQSNSKSLAHFLV
jgi:sialate O-acetylesterase